MHYKFIIESFDKTKIYLKDKETLFLELDNIFNYKKPINFFSVFSNNFIFTNSRKYNSNLAKYKINAEKYYNKDTIEYYSEFVNCLYIIYEEGLKVNLKELYEQYIQSRDFIFYKYERKYRYGTKNEFKTWKSSYNNRKLKTGFKSEYKYSFDEDISEYRINIRKERLSTVKSFNVKNYDDYRTTRYIHGFSNCWKDQSKKRKQYQ